MLDDVLDLIIENDTAVMKFNGEIIFDNSNQLKEEAKIQLTNKEVSNLIIDLSQVPYIDSSGVGVILSLFKFMKKRNGSLSIIEANEKITRVFDVTKMTEIIPVYTDLEAAMDKI